MVESFSVGRITIHTPDLKVVSRACYKAYFVVHVFKYLVKSVQSALSDLLTTSATHGTFSRPSMKRGLISIIKMMQFTIVRFF